jgi:hypothetical protein
MLLEANELLNMAAFDMCVVEAAVRLASYRTMSWSSDSAFYRVGQRDVS